MYWAWMNVNIVSPNISLDVFETSLALQIPFQQPSILLTTARDLLTCPTPTTPRTSSTCGAQVLTPRTRQKETTCTSWMVSRASLPGWWLLAGAVVSEPENYWVCQENQSSTYKTLKSVCTFPRTQSSKCPFPLLLVLAPSQANAVHTASVCFQCNFLHKERLKKMLVWSFTRFLHP